MHSDRKRRDGFTLTELAVLVTVSLILGSVLLADLVQDRAKLLQQACAANMKQWGMAIGMYMDDYNGVIYYDANGTHFTDSLSPIWKYFGTTSTFNPTIVNLRACPARVGLAAPVGTLKGYEIPVGQYRKGITYVNAEGPGSPYFRGSPANYWPDLKSVPVPAQYLLMTECYNTLFCGQLVSRMSNPAISIGSVDPLPPIARHGGGAVNCLFGDFHVEFVSSTTISNHDVNCNVPGNTWFDLN